MQVRPAIKNRAAMQVRPASKNRAAGAALAPSPADPRLVRALWQWLVAGLLLLLLVPATRGDNYWFGAGPYWLLVAPSLSLLTLYRQVIAAVGRAILVAAPHRRRPRSAGGQARRLRFGSLPQRTTRRAA
jgi:hypothetical protein